MEALDALMSRHSVREFVAGKAVPDEAVEKILRAAMQAPSARDKRPCHFIVLNKRESLDGLANGLPHAQMCRTATLAILVCGDLKATDAEYVPIDCATAGMSILLAAHSLGLGAVWTAVHPREDRMKLVREKLNLPSHVMPICLIPIGYPGAGAKNEKAKEKFDAGRIHDGKW